MRRQLLLASLPALVLGFAIAYLRMVAAERRTRRVGGEPRRPRAWAWVFGFGLAGLLLGALVGWLGGLANHVPDPVDSAVAGSFLLLPALVVGLGVGAGRWLGSRTVWRGRARGLR